MTAFIVTFVIWALLHSITATSGFKSRIRRKVGESLYQGLYRLFYNLFSIASFLPVLYVMFTQLPTDMLWRIPAPASFLANLVRLAGLAGLVMSLLQTDIWDFAGLRQAIHHLNGTGESMTSPKLVTTGTYSIVRHPLYFFSLLIIWFAPQMTVSSLAFNILATLYFWIGARYEEKRLSAFFGDDYSRYRQQVPAILPIKLPW